MVFGQGSVQGKAGGIVGFVVEVPAARSVTPVIWPHSASSMHACPVGTVHSSPQASIGSECRSLTWSLGAMPPTASRTPTPLSYSLGVMTEVVIPELFLSNGLSGACITPVAVAILGSWSCCDIGSAGSPFVLGSPWLCMDIRLGVCGGLQYHKLVRSERPPPPSQDSEFCSLFGLTETSARRPVLSPQNGRLTSLRRCRIVGNLAKTRP